MEVHSIKLSTTHRLPFPPPLLAHTCRAPPDADAKALAEKAASKTAAAAGGAAAAPAKKK